MESVLQLYGLAMVISPVYGFVSLRKRIRDTSLSKWAAFLRYVAIVFVPIVAYAALFFLCLGVEEMLPLSLVSEEAARSFPLAVALGLLVCVLGSMIFSLGLAFVRVEAKSPEPGPR